MIKLVLPYPPTINHYYTVARGRKIKSQRARAYLKECVFLLAPRKIKTIDGPVAVDIQVNPPDNRRRDIQNLQKGPLDALEAAGVYRDDSQIVDLRIWRGDNVKGGELVILVAEKKL
jgi:crossover junction endodeoxyribonuclease RusA